MVSTEPIHPENSPLPIFSPGSGWGLTSVGSISRVAAISRERACDLSEEADEIVQSEFLRHFPVEIVEKLGLVIAADGSFGRQMLVSGKSDVDLTFLASRDYGVLTPAEDQEFQTAKTEFTAAIKKSFGLIDLSVNDLYQCRLWSDLADEIRQSASGRLPHVKIAVESLTKFCSIRPLCGCQDALRGFSQRAQSTWNEITDNPDLKNQAVRNLIIRGSEIVAEHGLHKTVQDVKAQPLTLATACTALCRLLRTDANADAMAAVEKDLIERAYFLCAVREFLPRGGQKLEPDTNGRLSRAVRKVYGDQPEIVSQAYKSSAWIASCFEGLLDEAARQGCIAIAIGPDKDALSMEEVNTAEQLKGVFYKSGNVAWHLRSGLLQQALKEHLPELAALEGVPDCHDYQRLTLLRHSEDAVGRLDQFFLGQGDPRYISLTKELKPEDIAALYLATLLHDCGKPEEMRLAAVGGGVKQDPTYHAEFGSKLAREAATRLGFSEEQIETTEALVRQHLWYRHSKGDLSENMRQGLGALPEELRSSKRMKMLALLAYVDDASTDPANWNGLRANHVYELCHAYTCLLDRQPNGLALDDAGAYAEFLFARHRERLLGDNLAELREHLASFPSSHLALPPETICAFFNMAKAADISAEPQVQIVPHKLFESEQDASGFRYDVLFVGPDKQFLASNIAEIIAKNKLRVHSAGFSVNNEGRVFNQFTVTSNSDLAATIPEILLRIVEKSNAESLAVPKVGGFTFDTSVKISIASREARAGHPAFTEITLRTTDKEKLLLRFLVGLNKLGLSVKDAEITTSTGKGGSLIAVNRFQVINPSNPYEPLNERELRNKLMLEFRDPDQSVS